MYEYMSAEAYQPTREGDPLVFKCAYTTKTDEDRFKNTVTMEGFRDAVTKNGITTEKWERVIYEEYKELQKNYPIKKENYPNFKIIDKEGNQVLCYWTRDYPDDTVKIQKYTPHVQTKGAETLVSVIIFQPSWDYPTLYIIKDYKSLSKEVIDKSVQYTAWWWWGTNEKDTHAGFKIFNSLLAPPQFGKEASHNVENPYTKPFTSPKFNASKNVSASQKEEANAKAKANAKARVVANPNFFVFMYKIPVGLTERKEKLRTEDKWEYVIYHNYLTLMNDFQKLHMNPTPNNWKYFKEKHSKFELPKEKPDPLPNELNDITYTWKNGRNASTQRRSEIVRIHRHDSNGLSVIVMQPSWHGSDLDAWDKNDTLYVVDTSNVEMEMKELRKVVLKSITSSWGENGKNGAINTFIQNDKNKKAAKAKNHANYLAEQDSANAEHKSIAMKQSVEYVKAQAALGQKGPSLSVAQGGRSRKTRRTRRTRRRKTRRTRRK